MEREVYHDFGFELPGELQEKIGELEEALRDGALYIDCIQEEIRTLAHCYLDDEESEQVIDYYYRRRWL